MRTGKRSADENITPGAKRQAVSHGTPGDPEMPVRRNMPDSTGKQSAAKQQNPGFSPIYAAAETKSLLLSRLTYSKTKLSGDAATLARDIGDGLGEIRRLNGEIERRRRVIQGLWRVNGRVDNHYVNRFTGEVEQLVPQRDALLNQTQVWADEKRELDRKIAELVEGSAPSTRK
ncbi:hypothetical protein E8E11_003670 [Didymella keratinophila]|nr:hypothetical protein E8E11_003670 [Didymella keratinophila]